MTLNKIGEYKFRVQQVIKYILAKNLKKHYKKELFIDNSFFVIYNTLLIELYTRCKFMVAF